MYGKLIIHLVKKLLIPSHMPCAKIIKMHVIIKEISITFLTMKILVKNKCEYIENLVVENAFLNKTQHQRF